jgi:hypothetical protein
VRSALVALAGVVAGAVALLVAQAEWLPGPVAPALELGVVRAARAGAGAAGAPLATLLLAPLWRHLDAARAYELTKVAESVAFALAAVPGFFLARPLLGRDWALAVATVSVLVPAATWSAAASPLPLAYPLTTVALLAFVRYLEERRGRLLVTALATSALAGALWPALGALAVGLAALAVAVHPAARSLLHWPRAAVWIVLAVLAYVVWSVLVASSSAVAAADWPHGAAAAARSVGAWALGLGVVAPVAAVGGALRPGARTLGLTLCVAAVSLVPVAGVVAVGTGNAADERPLLALVPLVLTLAVLAIRAATARRPAVVAAGLVLLAAAVANRPRELRVFDPLLPGLQWLRAGGEVSAAALAATIVLAFVLGIALLVVAAGARARRVLAVVALVVPVLAGVAASVSAEHRAREQRAALPSPPTFLERVAGPVAVDPALPRDVLASLLFWNGDARALHPPLAARSVDPETGVYRPLVTGFPSLLTPDSRRARGTTIAQTPLGVVVRVIEPVAAAETITGVYADGWSGASVTYRRLQVTPGASLAVTLSRHSFNGPAVPDRVTVALGPLHGTTRVVRHLRVPSGATRVVRLTPPPRPFRVDLELDTFSPARYGSTDTRELGARLVFEYGP